MTNIYNSTKRTVYWFGINSIWKLHQHQQKTTTRRSNQNSYKFSGIHSFQLTLVSHLITRGGLNGGTHRSLITINLLTHNIFEPAVDCAPLSFTFTFVGSVRIVICKSANLKIAKQKKEEKKNTFINDEIIFNLCMEWEKKQKYVEQLNKINKFILYWH